MVGSSRYRQCIYFERKGYDKIVLNYNEVPEYNLRNNWKSLKSFFPNNRPWVCVMKDLEDPMQSRFYMSLPSPTIYMMDLSPGCVS
jgi:hypothetical protein